MYISLDLPDSLAQRLSDYLKNNPNEESTNAIIIKAIEQYLDRRNTETLEIDRLLWRDEAFYDTLFE